MLRKRAKQGNGDRNASRHFRSTRHLGDDLRLFHPLEMGVRPLAARRKRAMRPRCGDLRERGRKHGPACKSPRSRLQPTGALPELPCLRSGASTG